MRSIDLCYINGEAGQNLPHYPIQFRPLEAVKPGNARRNDRVDLQQNDKDDAGIGTDKA